MAHIDTTPITIAAGDLVRIEQERDYAVERLDCFERDKMWAMKLGECGEGIQSIFKTKDGLQAMCRCKTNPPTPYFRPIASTPKFSDCFASTHPIEKREYVFEKFVSIERGVAVPVYVEV